MKVLADFSGSNQPDVLAEGATLVYATDDGDVYLEHVETIVCLEDGEAPDEDTLYQVFMVPVPADVCAEQDWCDFADIAPVFDTTPEKLWAEGAGTDPVTRARVLETIARYHGWIEMDHAPFQLEALEVVARYRDVYGEFLFSSEEDADAP